MDGHLTEGTISNIFFVKKGQLYTPALSCGILEGVTRGILLQLARRAGIPAKEGRYTPRELLRADESFLSNTTLEVMPVVKVKWAGDRRLYRIGSGSPGPVTRRLHAIFRAHVEKESRSHDKR